jgi:hypothetical protein
MNSVTCDVIARDRTDIPSSLGKNRERLPDQRRQSVRTMTRFELPPPSPIEYRDGMAPDAPAPFELPLPFTAYPNTAGQTLTETLVTRANFEPFNVIATGIFLLAILHTFGTARFAALAHRVQHRQDEHCRASGRPCTPSVWAETLHFLGEVEVVFGLWVVALAIAMTAYAGWPTVTTT